MTNVEALKNIFVALGGSEDDFVAPTNADAINLIADALPDAFSAVLPAVTAEDNGSILKVVDGKWAKASS